MVQTNVETTTTSTMVASEDKMERPTVPAPALPLARPFQPAHNNDKELIKDIEQIPDDYSNDEYVPAMVCKRGSKKFGRNCKRLPCKNEVMEDFDDVELNEEQNRRLVDYETAASPWENREMCNSERLSMLIREVMFIFNKTIENLNLLLFVLSIRLEQSGSCPATNVMQNLNLYL